MDCGFSFIQQSLPNRWQFFNYIVAAKSIHGWFYCLGRPEERLRAFMNYAVSLGADRATWSRSQFVRMPDGTREGGARQAVYYFNPELLK